MQVKANEPQGFYNPKKTGKLGKRQAFYSLVEGNPSNSPSKNRREAIFALSRFASAGTRSECVKP